MADGDPIIKNEKSNMQVTDEDEQIIIDFVAVYKWIRKAGKFAVMGFLGFLGFIVLLSQAWDAVKAKLGH